MRNAKRDRVRLTSREIAAILAVAGDALPEETLRSDPDEGAEEQDRNLAAFESGMHKLRVLLGRMRQHS